MADKAMYFAKQNGRNRFAFYFEELKTIQTIILLESELSKAIENQDFNFHFNLKFRIKQKDNWF